MIRAGAMREQITLERKLEIGAAVGRGARAVGA